MTAAFMALAMFVVLALSYTDCMMMAIPFFLVVKQVLGVL